MEWRFFFLKRFSGYKYQAASFLTHCDVRLLLDHLLLLQMMLAKKRQGKKYHHLRKH